MLVALYIIKYLFLLWLLILITIDVLDRIKYRKEYKKQGSELINLQKEQKKLSEELKKILEDL